MTLQEQKELEDKLFKELQERLRKQPFKSFFGNNLPDVDLKMKNQVEQLEKRVRVLEDTIKKMKGRA